MTHKARKRFGQNFLHDPGVIGRIVASIHPVQAERLVEIGPGQGAITEELLPLVGTLHAVELDRDLIAPLTDRCAALGELIIHCADALKFDFTTLAAEGQLRVVGNLPYNISTPLLFHLLEQKERIKDMHFMLQKEVVDRMAADPGSKTYGRLSVMLQAWCEVTHLFDIGPGAFYPPPKVHSAFVRLVPYGTDSPLDPIRDVSQFSTLVTAAFAHRRKTLRNNLKQILSPSQITSCNIDPGDRAENLSVADFIRLADSLP